MICSRHGSPIMVNSKLHLGTLFPQLHLCPGGRSCRTNISAYRWPVML